MAKNIAIDVQIKNVKKITDLKNSLKELRKEQRNIEKETKASGKTTREQAQQYTKNEKAIKSQSKALRENKKALVDGTKSTAKANKATGSLTKSFLKAAGAITLVVGAFRTVSGAVSRTIATFTEFEFTMAKVLAVSGATDEEFKALTTTAEELGRTTFFTAEQVGQLQLAYSKLGFTAKEIQDAVKPTLDLATATGTDLARAAQVAGAAVRGFGLDASETERVVDVMAVSFSSSAMDIEKWQTGMTKVAPIAKAAGFSIEDTAAIMSKLSDSGIEASIAGTSLRNILLKMQDPSSELSKSFGSTIHSLDDLVPAMKKFVAEGGSMADIMEVVDLRQAAAFEQMLTTADGTLALRNELEDANGEGARMADIVGDTLQGAFLKLKSALQGVSISVMKDFAEGMQSGIEKAAGFFNMLAENSKTITTTIKFLGKLIRIVGLYKLGVLAATKGTRALRIAKVLLYKTNATLTASTITLTGAVNALKLSIKSLLSSTGIGMLVAFAPEILNFFGVWGDETEDLTEETDGLTESQRKLHETYRDTLKETAKTSLEFERLISLKEQMNELTDDEGKLLDDNAVNQKQYNSLKGQAAVLIRALNQDLEDNDQALIDEKTSIDDLTIAMQNLTKAMMEQSIADAFKRRMETITDEAANARITLSQLRKEIGKTYITDEWIEKGRLGTQGQISAGGIPQYFSYDEQGQGVGTPYMYLPPEGSDYYRYATNEELIAAMMDKSKVWKSNNVSLYPDTETLGDLPVNRDWETLQNTTITQQDWERYVNIMSKQVKGMKRMEDERPEDFVKRMFDKLLKDADISGESQADLSETLEIFASDYGLDLNEILIRGGTTTGGTTGGDGGPDPIAVTDWETLTKEALLVVKQKYDEAGASQEEYQIALAATRKAMLQQELDELNALEKLNLGQKKRKLDLETQIADATIAENQNTFKRQMELEQEKFNKLKQKTIEENTVRGKLTHDGQALLLQQEAEFLNTKLNLYNSYGQKIIGIDTDISKNKQAQHELQMKIFKDQLKAMGGIGSGLQDLAGDNEKLNKVKEAGILISKIAQGIEKAMLIQEQLFELGLIKKIALKKTDIALTQLQTTSNIGEAASENLSTGSILANTIATISSIIPKAISTILSAFSGPLGILKAIAAYAFIRKIMKMKFEDGGIISSDDKYAKGGMVYGKSHAQGGEKFSAGGRVVELEGGEAVINRKSTAMFRNQLSAMNEAGGGVRFADGGLLTSPQFTNSEFAAQNQLQMRDAMERQKKVVVVESDITESQSTVSVIQANASF